MSHTVERMLLAVIAAAVLAACTSEERSQRDGAFTSASARGGRLTGHIGERAATVRITSAEGKALDLDLELARDLRENANNRWIVSADGLWVKGTDVHPMQNVKAKTLVD